MIWKVLLAVTLILGTSLSEEPSQTLPVPDPKADQLKRLKRLSAYKEALSNKPLTIIPEQLAKGLKKIDRMNAAIRMLEEDVDFEELYEELGSDNPDINSAMFNGIFLKIDRLSADDIDEILNLRREPNIIQITVLNVKPADKPDLLKRLPHFSALRELNLDNLDMTDKDVRTLAEAGVFEDLSVLTLSHNRIHNPGAETIANTKSFPLLNHLDLSHNRIDEEGKKALMDAQHDKYEHLEELLLNDNNFNTPSKPPK